MLLADSMALTRRHRSHPARGAGTGFCDGMRDSDGSRGVAIATVALAYGSRATEEMGSSCVVSGRREVPGTKNTEALPRLSRALIWGRWSHHRGLDIEVRRLLTRAIR